MDAFVGPTELDEEIYDYLTEKDIELLIVLNKVDKTNQKELNISLNKVKMNFPESDSIIYSSKTHKYRQEALSRIFDQQ